MAVEKLIDTNIFLEILLGQNRKKECKSFLQNNHSTLAISDFSLHSIGVILFRNKKPDLYTSFCNDLLSQVTILSLPSNEYRYLADVSQKYKLDFDDSYQLLLAKVNDLKVATLDQDFKTAERDQIHFL